MAMEKVYYKNNLTIVCKIKYLYDAQSHIDRLIPGYKLKSFKIKTISNFDHILIIYYKKINLSFL